MQVSTYMFLSKQMKTILMTVDVKYPSSLNIFHAGSGLTAYIGTLKLASILIFANSCLLQGPTLYLDSSATDTSTFWTPAAVALSSVPMVVFQLMTGPFVNSVHVQLPDAARRSQQALQAFAARPPAETRLSFTTLRFFPLPKRRAVRLGDLRVLPPKMGRIANLEYLPPGLRRRCDERGRKAGWWEGLIAGRRRFHVRPGERFTASTQGPGVWKELLKVIEEQDAAIGENVGTAKAGSPQRMRAVTQQRNQPVVKTLGKTVARPKRK